LAPKDPPSAQCAPIPEFHLVRVGLQLEGGRQQLCDHQAAYGGPLLPALSTPTISLSMASPDQPPSTRKLAAILSADIAGYSALMSSDEEGTVRKLREVQEAVLPLIERFGGRVIDVAGDGILADFSSVVRAVESAAAVQSCMAELNAKSDPPMLFRIGVNVGDVIHEGERLYGDGINIAARLQAIAEPGGICISNKVHEEVRDRVNLAFKDIGDQDLKNIPRPVRAFSYVRREAVYKPRFATHTSMSSLPNNSTSTHAVSDKPSIAVLPLQNLSGDPEQEYFADGLAEDIITELSRFREFAVIARNSTFFYKGKPLDVAQVARDLRVRYVLEGSVRTMGKRLRVTVQLVDADTNQHIWAERYDREQADVFDVQEEVTRTVVASIAPQINLAEIARSRRETTNLEARQLAWRAEGMYLQAFNSGNAELMDQVITACQEAIAADPEALPAYATLAMAHYLCHLYRWGDRPEGALDRAWDVVERMMEIDAQDERTLTLRGWVRFNRGEYDGGLADLRRARDINPNFALALIRLAIAEAKAGMADDAVADAKLALQLSPRDYWIGTAHLALALAHFTLRDYPETIRWCESGIQVSHRAPIRRALMIACRAQAGELARAQAEIAVLNSFAPDFLSSVFRGENPVFIR
jgi:adenylate cyclase